MSKDFQPPYAERRARARTSRRPKINIIDDTYRESATAELTMLASVFTKMIDPTHSDEFEDIPVEIKAIVGNRSSARRTVRKPKARHVDLETPASKGIGDELYVIAAQHGIKLIRPNQRVMAFEPDNEQSA